MMLVAIPRPAALRLVARRHFARAPKPPFGLDDWSPDADAIAVLLDVETTAIDDPAAVAAQIPHARERPPGSAIFVLAAAPDGRSLIRRWLGPRPQTVSRAARCAALLARGYVELGAGADPASGKDVAWGRAPS